MPGPEEVALLGVWPSPVVVRMNDEESARENRWKRGFQRRRGAQGGLRATMFDVESM